ncbi:ATP-binding protein [Nocardioides sp.]|uniref:sensor histidine kinase n=1 Tax=Nocardioides sp. TaxID=35761 RepID=UPI0035615375
MTQASARTSARAHQALSRVGERDLQGIVDLVQSICEVEYAAIGILNDDEFDFVITAGVQPEITPLGTTLCQYSMTSPGLFVVPDVRADDRTKTRLFVDVALMELRFYASAPIVSPEGEMVGRLCVFDTKPKTLTRLQERTLLTFGESVSTILRVRLAHLDEADAVPLSRDLEMAARVSHDLRLPLTSLTASLEMLAETVTVEDAQVERLLASARRAADRMAGLVTGLMSLHQLSQEPVRTVVDLGQVVSRVEMDLLHSLTTAGGSLRCAALPRVHAEANLMYSVLLNLVSNAVKFARPGVPPEIVVSASRVSAGWRISVCDNGVGVPEESREAVFGMFTRLTSAAGHGIGLTTVARVVEAHGGDYGVAQPPGQPPGVGSDFWFVLPDLDLPDLDLPDLDEATPSQAPD